MKTINLSGKRGRNKSTIVDDSTFKKYGHLSWYLSDTGYVMRSTPEGNLRLHRLVTNTPENKVTDHLNGNKLDNRKSNLRVCTQKENANNRKNTKGYTWDKSKSKWLVRYKNKFFGRYKTEEEAKEAYKRARSGVEYHKKERRQMYHLPTGVFKNKSSKGYQARIQINGKRKYLGTFPTVEQAQRAYLDKKEG